MIDYHDKSARLAGKSDPGGRSGFIAVLRTERRFRLSSVCMRGIVSGCREIGSRGFGQSRFFISQSIQYYRQQKTAPKGAVLSIAEIIRSSSKLRGCPSYP